MNLKSLAGPALGLAFVLALPGCGMLEDRSERYVDAPEGEPLKLPEGLQGDRLSQVMAVREITPADSARMFRSDIPRPPDMTSEILEENYVIEELGSQSWLLVNDVPGRVWPAVTAWMNERGLGVAEDNPQTGVMQSELANYSKRARAVLGLPDQAGGTELKVLIQARISPGVRRKTTEIQLHRRDVAASPDGLLPWDSGVDRSAELRDAEKRLLADLGEFMRTRDDTKSYSRAALGMSNAPRVRLMSENEQAAAIHLDLDYERGWAELHRALGEAKVPVVDLDRSAGIFYVDFRSEDELDPGFFSWFADDPKPEYTFQVRLAKGEDGLLVTAGKAPDYQGSDRSAKLLSRLFEYLY